MIINSHLFSTIGTALNSLSSHLHKSRECNREKRKKEREELCSQGIHSVEKPPQKVSIRNKEALFSVPVPTTVDLTIEEPFSAPLIIRALTLLLLGK